MPADADSARAAVDRPADTDAGSDSSGRSALGGFGAGVREFVIVAALALALSFVVKTFLVQAFYIPSQSMEDTLVKGDRVIVSKLTPGPFELKRGDVVVFQDPGQWLPEATVVDRGPVLNGVQRGLTYVGLVPDTAEGHLIKRVIGLPGDHITCCDDQGRLTINGKATNEPYLKPGQAPSAINFDITVPVGRVWVMGDNRGNSSDSRLHDPSGDGTTGSVPQRLIVGRAVALVWPFNRMGLLSNHQETFSSVPSPAADPSKSSVGP